MNDKFEDKLLVVGLFLGMLVPIGLFVLIICLIYHAIVNFTWDKFNKGFMEFLYMIGIIIIYLLSFIIIYIIYCYVKKYINKRHPKFIEKIKTNKELIYKYTGWIFITIIGAYTIFNIILILIWVLRKTGCW